MRNKKAIRKAIDNPDFSWLGRENFIEDFSEYILSQEKSTHVCINGVWGSGKTTTVLGIIDYINRQDYENKETPLILYLDAWEYEHYEHPLFSLLKVMEKDVPEITRKIEAKMQEILPEIQVGLNLSFFNFSITSQSKSNQKKIISHAEYIDALNEFMIIAIQEYKIESNNQLIVFVDELDRAKPDFVLRTLEMFHHIQDELPTHIVYSVDMDQLNSIIKHYYGYEYNVEIFVHKVFDTIINLEKVSKSDLALYVEKLFVNSSVEFSVNKLTDLLFTHMTITQSESLRTINKVCQNITSKLKKGYFISSLHFFDRSGYFLGEKAENIWGYIELLIILEIQSLINPIEVRSFLKGRSLSVLVDHAIESSENRDSSLWDLIEDSFNYEEKVKLSNKKSQELTRENITIALRRIFNPPTPTYENKAVFSEFNF